MTAILVAPDESFRRHLHQRLVQADCEDVRLAEPPAGFEDLLLECGNAVAVLGGRWPELRPFLRVAVRAEGPAIVVLQQQVAFGSTSPDPVPRLGESRSGVALRLGASGMVDEHAREALEMGARGVVHADISDSGLKAALAASRAGLIVIDSGLEAPRESMNGAPSRPHTERQPRQLTMRERKILSLIASGVSNKGVARSLGVSVNTVKFHLTAAFQKLDATTRAKAVTEAIRRGELSI